MFTIVKKLAMLCRYMQKSTLCDVEARAGYTLCILCSLPVAFYFISTRK